MTAQLRSCSRTGCRWPAAASLSFRYSSRQVWLVDLADPDPALYDLCPHHADTLIVPKGWDRVDQRTTTPVGHEPSSPEFAQRAERPEEVVRRREREHLPVPAGTYPTPAVRVNRYEHLFSELPKLAAEVAALCGNDARVHPERRARPDSGGGVIVPLRIRRRLTPKG